MVTRSCNHAKASDGVAAWPTEARMPMSTPFRLLTCSIYHPKRAKSQCANHLPPVAHTGQHLELSATQSLGPPVKEALRGDQCQYVRHLSCLQTRAPPSFNASKLMVNLAGIKACKNTLLPCDWCGNCSITTCGRCASLAANICTHHSQFDFLRPQALLMCQITWPISWLRML